VDDINKRMKSLQLHQKGSEKKQRFLSMAAVYFTTVSHFANVSVSNPVECCGAGNLQRGGSRGLSVS
jgi:hypothetical protein